MDYSAVLAAALAANVSGGAPVVLPHEPLIAAARRTLPEGDLSGEPWRLACARRLSELPPGVATEGCTLLRDGRAAEVEPPGPVIDRLMTAVPPVAPHYAVEGLVYLFPGRAEFVPAGGGPRAAVVADGAIEPPTRDAISYMLLFVEQTHFAALDAAARRHGASSDEYRRIARGLDSVKADALKLYEDVAALSRDQVEARPEFATRLDSLSETLHHLLTDAGWTPEDSEIPEGEMD